MALGTRCEVLLRHEAPSPCRNGPVHPTHHGHRFAVIGCESSEPPDAGPLLGPAGVQANRQKRSRTASLRSGNLKPESDVMIRERPGLDRKRVLAEEALRRRTVRLLTNIVGELGDGEHLGPPVRIADRIVIPILRHVPTEIAEGEAEHLLADPLPT